MKKKVKFSDYAKEMKSLRKEGKSVKYISDKFGCSDAMVCHITGSGFKHGGTRKKEALIDRCKVLIDSGMTRLQVAKELGMNFRYITNICVGMQKNNLNMELKSKIIALRESGMSVELVSKELGIGYGNVVEYSKGHKFRRIRKSRSTKPKMDKVAYRAKLQKGNAVVKVAEKVFKPREETGRAINIMYSDLFSTPTQKATIFTRHDGSDYEAVELWAKKYNKKSFALSV